MYKWSFYYKVKIIVENHLRQKVKSPGWRISRICRLYLCTSVRSSSPNECVLDIIIIMSSCQHGSPWLFLVTLLYRPSLPGGFRSYILYWHRGARGVIVIVAGNGLGNTSSNPGPDWLHFHIAPMPLGKVWIQ